MNSREWTAQYMQTPHRSILCEARECPFCQSRKLDLWRSSSTYVECLSCGATGPEVRGRSSLMEDPDRTAVNRWNKAARS